MTKEYIKPKSIMELMEQLKEQTKEMEALCKEINTTADDVTKQFVEGQKLISKLEAKYGE